MSRERHTHGYSSFVRILLVVSASLLILSQPAFADTIVLTRIIDEIGLLDISAMDDVKLSASLQTDRRGDLVVKCLNLFTIPLAEKPFDASPGLRRVLERTEFEVKQKGNGLLVRIAFKF